MLRLGGNISDNDQGGKQLPNIARTEVRVCVLIDQRPVFTKGLRTLLYGGESITQQYGTAKFIEDPVPPLKYASSPGSGGKLSAS